MDLDIGKQITAFFKSRKLAIILILLIILLSVIGTYIPQRSQIKLDAFNTWEKSHPIEAKIYDILGFTHIFSSFIFVSISALLFINTLFCTWGMLTNSLKRYDPSPQFKQRAFINNLELNSLIKTEKSLSDVKNSLRSVLLSHGYKISNNGNLIVAQKNRIGAFGIPLFHFCVMFLMIAAVYGSTGRMEGDMRLIEGQTLSEDHANYMFINEGPFFYENHKKFDISLERFYADHTDETGTLRGPTGKLSVIENGKIVKTDIVYSNHQMDYNGYTFLGNVYGLAPLLILRNPDGSVYSGSYVTAIDQDESKRYVSYFDLGNTGMEAGLMVYMTATLTANIAESVVKQEPILFLKIFDKGTEIYNGTMHLNDTVQIGDKTLGFYDIKYWSNFYVVKDDSMPLILLGFGLMTLGIFVSYFIIPKRIWVELIENEDLVEREIHIGGKSDKFKSLYEDDFSGIINDLKKEV